MAENKDKLVTAGGLKSVYQKIKSTFDSYYTKDETDAAIENINVTDQLKDYLKSEDAEKTYETISNVTSKITSVENALSAKASTSDVSELSSKVATLETQGDVYSYEVDYGTAEINDETKDNVFTFYQVENKTGDKEVTSQFVLAGGSGGSALTSTVTITADSLSLIGLIEDEALNIKYNWTSIDNAGQDTGEATAKWYVDKVLKYTDEVPQGDNTFNIKPYLTDAGTYKVRLEITDSNGSMSSKTWTVRVVSLSLTSDFNDAIPRLKNEISFTYNTTGNNIDKTIYFTLDGTQIGTVTSSYAGSNLSFTIPVTYNGNTILSHGSHLLDVYMEATINNIKITSEHLYKDIIIYEEDNMTPIISCAGQTFTAKQYNTTNITYTIYDPTTNSPKVQYIKVVNGEDTVLNNLTLSATGNTVTQKWAYRSSVIGSQTLKIICENSYAKTEKVINVTIAELGISIEPVSGEVFCFNPAGYDNNDEETRLWNNGNENNLISMTVSDNFDWTNGGYHTDDDGNAYFNIKAGTTATFDYKMFSGTPSKNIKDLGSELKIIFKTENVQTADATWFTNAESITKTTEDGDVTTVTGIQLNVHEGWLKTNNATSISTEDLAATNSYLYLPYSEDDIIELDINVDTKITDESNKNYGGGYIMSYEDGVPSKAYIYSSSDVLYQENPQVMTIGSEKCDVRIYLLKAYEKSLSTDNIMQNFIADASNSIEMIDRYNRNSIYYNKDTRTFSPYSSNGVLDPEKLAEACPDIKILMMEAPNFTTSKKTFIKNTNLRCIHKNGDALLDNWYFENGYHSGQGTTSDNYGLSSRNVDFLFNVDGIHQPSDKITTVTTDYVSKLTLGYGTEDAVTYTTQNANDINDQARVTLTRTSIPNNFFNFKVNVASSENANNALLQKRFNDYLPVESLAKKRNSNIKNDMEFIPAILFIKENSEDLTTHKEFNDTEWHFYSLGNIGDSKKTDYTRAYDPTDINEFTLEISDNSKNNATFQSGVYKDADGNLQYEQFTLVRTLDEDGKLVETPTSKGIVGNYIYPITDMSLWNISGNVEVDNRTGDSTYDTPVTGYLNMRRYCLENEGFDGDHSFEPRYACCGDHRDGKLVDQMGLNEGFTDKTTQIALDKAQLVLNADVWRAFYRWVITATDDEFKAELPEWCVQDAVEFFYVYTLNWTMMDNRAKNTFWHFAKTGTYRQVSKPVKELLHIYAEYDGENYTTTTDTEITSGKTYYTQYAFDLWDYDNDTALGINNNGELIFPYGKEDIDYQTDGDANSGYVFNGATSTFWCRLRDLFSTEIATLYSNADKVKPNCWNAENLIKEFDEFQSSYPEEIWRLDIERKYLRVYNGTSVDNSIAQDPDTSYLKNMMQGKKKYQRRQWVRDQHMYFATKFGSEDAASTNIITFRVNTPTGDVAVAPKYDFTLTPYSDLYLRVMCGNGNTISIRAKAGKEYTISSGLTSASDTQFVIYGADHIQAIGDLSSCYVRTASFAQASRLKTLVIGSDVEGYENSFLTEVGLGNNKLLESLDIRNCTSLSNELNFSNCSNFRTLLAENTKLTSVIFATNGNVETVHLPSTINSLTMRKLQKLVDFQCALTQIGHLTIQEPINTTGFNTLIKLPDLLDTLSELNLSNINWSLSTTDLLNNILTNVTYSTLSGEAVIAVGRNSEKETYNTNWPDLLVTLTTLTPESIVTFKNYDDTVIDVISVPLGEKITPTDIIPTKPSTESTVYTFDEWDYNFDNVAYTSEITIYPKYTESVRKYIVQYIQDVGNKTIVLKEPFEVEYGTSVSYDFYNETTGKYEYPTYTDAESYFNYYLFTGWDHSEYITEDTTIKAVFNNLDCSNETVRNTLIATANENFNSLTPIELYALMKLNEKEGMLGRSLYPKNQSDTNSIIQQGDTISMTLGNDIKTDFESASWNNLIFTGSSCTDTNMTLFDTNKDFTLAIDFSYTGYSQNSNAAILSCYDTSLTPYRGFEIGYTGTSSGSKKAITVYYNNSSQVLNMTYSNRDVLVLRYSSKNKKVYFYHSNLGEATIDSFSFDITDVSLRPSLTLKFGGRDESSNLAKGTIYWCTVWQGDIGESKAKELAIWPKESLDFTVRGFKKFYNDSGSDKNILCLLSDKTLSRQYTYGTYTTSNVYDADTNTTKLVYHGENWNNSTIKPILNNKLYNAIPLKWRVLLKNTRIPYIIPDTFTNLSPEIGICYDYITMPAWAELYNTNSLSFENEIGAASTDTGFKYIYTNDTETGNAGRIRKNQNNAAVAYATRTPDIRNDGYPQYHYINSSGTCELGWTASISLYVVPEIFI